MGGLPGPSAVDCRQSELDESRHKKKISSDDYIALSHVIATNLLLPMTRLNSGSTRSDVALLQLSATSGAVDDSQVLLR